MRGRAPLILFLLSTLVVLSACGGAQKKRCFECGITDEWARADAERDEERRAQEAEGEGAAGEGEGEGENAAEEQPDGEGAEAATASQAEELQGMAAALSKLEIHEPTLDGYDRHDWKHWVDADGDCQDTRQEVLIAESEIPVTFKTPRQCKVLTGQWTCPYTGEVFTNPRKLDIDHMVPLGAAHAAGGSAWDPERRRAFANSLETEEHLIAVKASANRSKGKRGPDEWLPPDESYVCTYVEHWIQIKVEWELSVNESERAALEALVANCP